MHVSRSITITCLSPLDFGPPSMGTFGGSGYGPRSDSDAYWKRTGTRRVRFETTAYGIPFGAPSQTVPKSGCTGVLVPMLAISRAEFPATGSLSTRWFHGLLGGKIGQARAPGRGWAKTSPGTTTNTGTATSVQHPRSMRRRRMDGDYMHLGGGGEPAAAHGQPAAKTRARSPSTAIP